MQVRLRELEDALEHEREGRIRVSVQKCTTAGAVMCTMYLWYAYIHCVHRNREEVEEEERTKET